MRLRSYVLEHRVETLYDVFVVSVSEVNVREEYVERILVIRSFFRNEVHLSRFVFRNDFFEFFEASLEVGSDSHEPVRLAFVRLYELPLVPVFVRFVRNFNDLALYRFFPVVFENIIEDYFRYRVFVLRKSESRTQQRERFAFERVLYRDVLSRKVLTVLAVIVPYRFEFRKRYRVLLHVFRSVRSLLVYVEHYRFSFDFVRLALFYRLVEFAHGSIELLSDLSYLSLTPVANEFFAYRLSELILNFRYYRGYFLS